MVAAAVAAAIVQISATPAFAARDGQVRVAVRGLDAPAADVVIHGGIASGGKMFGLVPLRDLGHGAWWTILRAPGFYGVYPVRLRAGGVYRETPTVVDVLPRSFGTSPGAATPQGVVEAWREASPQGATIRTSTTWRAGFYYHRDQRYNRLLRVEFTLLSDWPRYRLRAGTWTKWFDVSRTSLSANWHLVQVVDAP